MTACWRTFTAWNALGAVVLHDYADDRSVPGTPSDDLLREAEQLVATGRLDLVPVLIRWSRSGYDRWLVRHSSGLWLQAPSDRGPRDAPALARGSSQTPATASEGPG